MSGSQVKGSQSSLSIVFWVVSTGVSALVGSVQLNDIMVFTDSE